MKRKDFLSATAMAGMAIAMPINIGNASIQPKTIKGNRLRKGDTLGLIAPAGFISEKEMNESITNLENLGFKVKAGKYLLNKHGYLAGTDTERAEDVNAMFADSSISGIVCARGGYGCVRMLDKLDYSLISKNPKVLIGYSDITSLIYALYQKAGLVAFHGPVGISTFNEYSVNNFSSALLNPSTESQFYNAADEDLSKLEYNPYTIRSGKAIGKLVGGNLSIVASLIGTEYDISTDGAIIFLEEIGEEPYRIDRMLTQMIQAGKFKNASGVALGVFSRCESKPSQSGISNSFSLKEVLMDRLFPLNIPTVYGMSFGHITNKMTLPVGIKAELNVDDLSLKFLETAVN
ncbi:MAG: LD-carboxypeptidase [Ignavibacteriaceae bacterium]|nr:LD-carboxypeptidase [Ignavibacteriaceae bacterium]